MTSAATNAAASCRRAACAMKAQCGAGTSPGSNVPSKANPGSRAGLQSGRQEINKQSEADRAAKPPARERGIASQNGFNRKLKSYLQGVLRAPPVERVHVATTRQYQQSRTSTKLGW
jgi:hypothetical protein